MLEVNGAHFSENSPCSIVRGPLETNSSTEGVVGTSKSGFVEGGQDFHSHEDAIQLSDVHVASSNA
jgi:hypothetical protein